MTYSTRYFGMSPYRKMYTRKIYLSTGTFLCNQMINENGIPKRITGENRFLK